MRKLDVAVVGFGQVGQTVAGLLLRDPDIAWRIAAIDPSSSVDGAFLDLYHAVAAGRGSHLLRARASAIGEADLVVFTAGEKNPPGTPRLAVADSNLRLARRVFGRHPPARRAAVVVVTNPVDLVTQAVAETCGLPAGRVVGTGTGLETLRLRMHLAEEAHVDPARVEALVLGEHGDSQVPVLSRCRIEGRPVRERLDERALRRAVRRTRTAAERIRRTQPGTWWAVASLTVDLLRALAGEAPVSIPVSVRPAGGWRRIVGDDVFLGLPCRVDARGARVLPCRGLDEAERRALRRSAAVLRAHLARRNGGSSG